MRRLSVILLAACGSSPSHAPDAPLSRDARPADAATDAASSGFGELTGMCGVLQATDLTSTAPKQVLVNFHWTTGYVDPDDRPQLTPGGQHMAATPNAGGSSGLSEIFAYEQLARCEGATFLKSETEIAYEPPTSKKTDLEILLDGHKLGVSVTRAFKGPFGSGALTMAAALELSNRKFSEIHDSTAGTSTTADKWDKQILAVQADTADDATTFLAATATLDPTVIGDTILVLTTTDGADAFIYTNQ